MPIYLAMGMTVDQYWNGDPYLAVVFQKKQALLNEQKNTDAWWQGLYIYDALETIAAKLTGTKRKVSYPKEPYKLKSDVDEQNERKKRAEQEKAVKYFNDLKTRLSKKYGRDQRDQSGINR